jgi:ribonuclease HI
MRKIIIQTDGGSRGNPGPSAIGVVISLERGDKAYGEYIGTTTNNVAEYKAVIFALKKTKQLITRAKAKEAEIELQTDSELVYKHMNGLYKIKDKDLRPLFIELWNLLQDFKKVKIVHVTRDNNKKADKLVNSALNTLNI